MANDYFSFKQFTVKQGKTAMKVGIDGVLLGAWTNVDNAVNVLDIGTGTGLVALMIAQRNAEAVIDAIEIDAEAAEQAAENVADSTWSNRINVINDDINNFTVKASKKYDLIVSNPPFFDNSLKSDNEKRNAARHSVSLSFNQLILCVKGLLNKTGTFSVIIPYDRFDEFVKTASGYGLYVFRVLQVCPYEGKSFHRVIIELSKTENNEILTEKLSLRNNFDNNYTDEYKFITKEFYLKF